MQAHDNGECGSPAHYDIRKITNNIVKEYENSKINTYSVSTVFLINRIGRDFLFVRHETGIRHHNARADFD